MAEWTRHIGRDAVQGGEVQAQAGSAVAECAPPVHPAVLRACDFDAFQRLVYNLTGIRLTEQKAPMLSNRLRPRLRELGLSTFADYYNHLKQQGPASDEFYRFLEVITTNETFFFRNRPLWSSIETDLLPTLIQRRPGPEPLVFWSAASSSGEEPYTLSIMIHRNRHLLGSRPVRILASDISNRQLVTAKAARYGPYAVSRLSPVERGLYFLKEGDTFRLRREYAGCVEFFFHNLKQPMRRCRVDCAILRNVLIYFDPPMCLQALRTVTEPLRLGGLLIVGDVDPLHTQPDLMDQLGVQYIRPWTYEKVRDA